jgi:hypothetical protein
MGESSLILAGIGAARHWPDISLDNLRIMRIPPNVYRWNVPILDRSRDQFDWDTIETIELEHFRSIAEDSIYLGYSTRTNLLVFWIPEKGGKTYDSTD